MTCPTAHLLNIALACIYMSMFTCDAKVATLDLYHIQDIYCYIIKIFYSFSCWRQSTWAGDNTATHKTKNKRRLT